MKQPTDKTHRYSAALIFEIASSAPDDAVSYEEDIVVIEATSMRLAREKATVYGKEQNNSYENEAGDAISTRFKVVANVCEMDGIEPGASLHSRSILDYDAYVVSHPILSEALFVHSTL